MNKYEEAYEVIDTILHLMCGEENESGFNPTHDEMVESMKVFEELVKKATPKKPTIKPFRIYVCSICGNELCEGDYCCNCGHAIDWSWSDEK